MTSYVREQIDLINQKINELNFVYHLAAAKSGVSDGQIDIWSVLLNADSEYSQQDLCSMLSLSKQTVNSLISGFVKKGFVRLEHAKGFRNRKVIMLTEEGRRYGNEKVKWIFEAEQKAMEETDINEVKACISMLEKYILRFKKEIEEENINYEQQNIRST